MKAERRHELRENDLLHAMGVAKDYINENGGRIGLVIIGVFAVAMAVMFGMRSRAAAQEDIWRQKSELSFSDGDVGRVSLSELATLTSSTDDEQFILQSLLDRGKHALRLTAQAAFPPDLEFNEHARGAFEELLKRFPANALAQGVALTGLATVEENAFAFDGEMKHKEAAKKYLDETVANPLLNGMPFQRLALDRLKTLDATFGDVIYEAPTMPPEEESPEEAAEVDPADPADLVDPVDPPVQVDSADGGGETP